MDLNQLNEDLLRLRQAVMDGERQERALQRAEHSLAVERQSLSSLTERFKREDQQVRRLEGLSLVGLIYTVLGSKENRLSEQRHELLGVKLKYDNARRRVAGLERDIADLTRQTSGLDALRAQYAALLAEKEAQLKAQPGPEAQALDRLGKDLADARSQERELSEAIQSGDMAFAGLNRAAQALDSASGWGTWDILGGGMLASMAKHAKLDEAQAMVQEIQPLLQRFERELSDVGGSFSLDIETGGLAAFADIFTDNLLVDLLVQSRISDSLEAAQSMALRIRDLVTRLSREREAALRRVESLERSRRELLEQVR